jgi:hypothetical protein
MISTLDNCLFVHIPKTGGQSIESVFLQRAGLTWEQREAMLLKKNHDPTMGPPRLAHLFAVEYVKLGYITAEQFNRFFKFSFVRNPWHRLVSEYLYRKYPYSFKDFVFKHFPTSINDDYTKGFDGYRHVIPQYKFLYDEQENLLVDFVGKFEQITEDFAKVTQILTGQPLKLPHRNQSKISYFNSLYKQVKPQLSYVDYYDNETREFVAALYEKDIQLFNYQF